MDLKETRPNQQSDTIKEAIGDINTDSFSPQIQPDPSSVRENKEDPYQGNDMYRNDKLKAVFHWVVVWGIRFAFFIFISVFLIRVLHLVLPHRCRWLTDEDIQGIDKLFFSGTVGGVIGRYIKVVIPNK